MLASSCSNYSRGPLIVGIIVEESISEILVNISKVAHFCQKLSETSKDAKFLPVVHEFQPVFFVILKRI